jgi:hypothetical protein
MFTHRSASKVKAHISSTVKAHLIRGAFYLLLVFAVCVIAFAFGQRLIGAPSTKEKPTGGICFQPAWTAGPDMQSTDVRMVGVLLNKFYAMGGRAMDGVGNDFTHPFEYDTFTQTWTIQSAAFPDNQVTTWLAAPRP